MLWKFRIPIHSGTRRSGRGGSHYKEGNFGDKRWNSSMAMGTFLSNLHVLAARIRRFAKGWLPKGWYWRMFPGTKSQNEDTFWCSPVRKTRTRVHSDVPGSKNRNEGTFAKTTFLRNRPCVPSHIFPTHPTLGYFKRSDSLNFASCDLPEMLWPDINISKTERHIQGIMQKKSFFE